MSIAILGTGLILAACTPRPDSQPVRTEGVSPGGPAISAPIYDDGPIRGALPDGTEYDVIFSGLNREPVQEVSAAVEVPNPGGDRPIIAEVSFHHPRVASDPGWQPDRVYRIGTGEWSVEFDFGAASDLGRLEASISVTTNLGMPLVTLSPPLAWADDHQLPMQVRYQTFVVRRGCDEVAVACNATHAVQVIPLEELSSEAPDFPAGETWIESYALRPEADPAYLDPGPLSARSGHDLIWSGEEMILWGGAHGGRTTHLVEGAAFNPRTNRWRLLSKPPLRDEQPTRAVWTGGEMVVISPQATVAYQPAADRWAELGGGVETPIEPGLTVWTGATVMTWAGDGIHLFETGEWRLLPDPGPDWGELGVLRVLEGQVYAVATRAGGCQGPAVARWAEADWEEIPPPPTNAWGEGCFVPRQSAAIGSDLMLWAGPDRPTLAYHSGRGLWQEMAPFPLDQVDRPSGPVPRGDNFGSPVDRGGHLPA